MSRVIIFDKQSDSLGQITTLAPRGWQIGGIERTNGGGTTSWTLPRRYAVKPFLQLGNMAYVEHETLPVYAGVIDVPWRAIPPAKISIYNAEYLMTLRYPDRPGALTGSVAYIASQLIGMANEQEDTYIRAGDMSQAETVSRTFVIDQRNLWDQLNNLCATSGMEMIFRPERNPLDRKLYIYIDIGLKLGHDTDALLHDGRSGNMIVQNAELSGDVVNRVVGTGSQSNTANRLYTEPMLDHDSISKYRLRSRAIQFRDVAQQDALNTLTQTYLEAMRRPLIKLNILIFDRDDGRTFRQLRLGNSYWVHSTKVLLPGGKQGWRNMGRTVAMAYNEADNTVGMIVEGFYE